MNLPISDVWTLQPEEIRRFQSRDADFTAVLNSTLQAAAAGCLPDAALRLNLKTQIPDAGVDAAVDRPIPDVCDPSEYLRVPTCWQFKAMPNDHIKSPPGGGGKKESLLREMRKPHVQELLGKGYGYRFCIADSLAPKTRSTWEGWMLEEARRVDPAAPPPIVLTAELLAAWLSRFPGIVKQLRPFLTPFEHFENWLRRETADAPNYFPVATHSDVAKAVREFVDFGRPATDPLLVVSGEVSSGKTRLVLETLGQVPGVGAITVVSRSASAAMEWLSRASGNLELRAVCVIDGDERVVRSRIRRMLNADRNRLRVILIDNGPDEDAQPHGEFRLPAMSQNELDAMLADGFPELHRERRWAVAQLCEGLPGLAIGICNNIRRLAEDGGLAPLSPLLLEEYFTSRLNNEDRRVVELLALVSRVGVTNGSVVDELDTLCRAAAPAFDLPAHRVLEVARRLHSTRGYVRVGHRYVFVRPRLIAQVAFHSALRRLGTSADRFFAALPETLQDAFCRQLRDAGTPEMRRAFVDSHVPYGSALPSEVLTDAGRLRRVVRLVEIIPEQFFPPLCRLIETASADEIRRLDSLDSPYNGRRWKARRELVWLAEWMMRFANLFPFAEILLYRFALLETETCGNNATGIWCQSFRPLLSGTPVPYLDRLKLLEERISRAKTEAEIALCLSALSGPLTSLSMAQRQGAPALIAGRMPQPDWHPGTAAEFGDVRRAGIDLAVRLARHPDPRIGDAVISTVVRCSLGLLAHGLVDDVAAAVSAGQMTDRTLAAILSTIDTFFDVYCGREKRHVSEELEAKVRAWQAALTPHSFRGRLRTAIGRPYYELHRSEREKKAIVAGLAEEFFANPGRLADEISWLCTEAAQSAHALGWELGRRDAGAVLFDRIVDAAPGQSNPSILSSYLVSLLDTYPDHAAKVCEALDRLTPDYPALVFAILLSRLPLLDPSHRTLRMIDDGLLPATTALQYYRPVPQRPLVAADLNAALSRLLPVARANSADASRASLELLEAQIRERRQRCPAAPVFEPEVLPIVWEVLNVTPTADLGHDAWVWTDVLAEYEKADPNAAIRLAVETLANDRTMAFSNSIETYLARVVREHPAVVLEEIGTCLVQNVQGSRLSYHNLQPVFAAVPVEISRAWVEVRGLAGARAIASLLPKPEIKEGAPWVHELTEFVLNRFADDGEVFDAFACEGTTGVLIGDPTACYERDAEIARSFFTHPCVGIQKWAQDAERRARHSADIWRGDDEEWQAP